MCWTAHTAGHKMKSVKNHLALGDNGNAASLRAGNPNKNVVPNSFWTAQFTSQYRPASRINKFNPEISSQAYQAYIIFSHSRQDFDFEWECLRGSFAFLWRPCVYRWALLNAYVRAEKLRFQIKSITKPQYTERFEPMIDLFH